MTDNPGNRADLGFTQDTYSQAARVPPYNNTPESANTGFEDGFTRSRPARTNIYEELYDTLIDDQGNRAIWEQAAVCRCLSADSGQPDFTCPICHGRGYRYLQGQELVVGVTSFNGNFKSNTLQLYEPGTAYCTPMSNVIMGFMDRLSFPDFTCKYSEVLRFNSDENGLGVSNKTYRPVIGVVSLADDQYEYECGVDYEITEDKHHIRWLSAQLAASCDHHTFSFLYLTTPVYLVTDVLHELRGTRSDRNAAGVTYRELPKQYRLQREMFTYGVKDPAPVEQPAASDEDGDLI